MKVFFPRIIKSGASVMAPSIKNGLWMLGGVVLAAAITVGAQQAPSASPTVPCDDLTKAMSAALQKNITMVGGMQPDPAKYFPGGSSSLICGISLLNLDLSLLIPDLTGLLTTVATKALNAAMSAACAAVTRTFGSTINQVNSAINMANGITSGSVIQNAIDSSVSKSVDKTLGQYATNYNNAPSTLPVIGAGFSNPQAPSDQAPSFAPPKSTPFSVDPTPVTNSAPPLPAAASKSASAPSILSCLLGGC